jgi:flagellar hook assembly protein FlgD
MAQPTGFTLEDAYPNPFDRTTTVRFSVDEAQPVTLTLYDSVGRAVRTLYEGTLSAGVTEQIVIDGSSLPSGSYTVRLDGASVSGSTRIVVLK